MLSDLSCSTFPFDIPDPSPEEDPLAPLNFDDLLDIAHEFEFTHTIAHIWPCDEGPDTYLETGLEDIFAAIVPTPNTEDSPLPLPSSALSIPPDPVYVQDADLHSLASMCPVHDVTATISRDSVHVSKNVDQVSPIIPILQGWSPPSGSQFLDLDDNLMLPQSMRDIWTPPWLATFLTSSYTQLANSNSQSLAMISAFGDVQLQTSVTEPSAPPVSITHRTTDDLRKKSVPLVTLPVQPPTCAVLEPVQARSALRDSNVPSRAAATHHTKTSASKSRLPSSTPVTGGTSTPKYAKAPRGGIPPHIARTVTKANILRVEKERKVMRDAFSGTTTEEGKKPSVLRRSAKVEREASKATISTRSGKKLFAWDENDEEEERVTKRARI